MDKIINTLQDTFKYLKVDKVEEEEAFVEKGEVPKIYVSYIIGNFNGNKNITISLDKEDEVKTLIDILSHDPYILEEYLGVKYQDKFEIVVYPINSRYIQYHLRKQNFEIHLNYFKNELKIKIESNIESGKPAAYLNFQLNRAYQPNRRTYILTIENYKRSSPDGINADLRNIINSVLFDFEYSFSISFEAIELNTLNRRVPRMKRPSLPVPNHPIQFSYKKYIPELIQYFHLAEKVEQIPFKYLCYFHIVEYFSDKSAYFVITEQVKQILLKPDFHLKSDTYIGQAINIFKKENEKYLTDKIKLARVLQQFVNLKEFLEYLEEIKLLDHFKQEQTFNCSKPLKVAALDFTTENSFIQTLTNRIYSVRCSIVHSNPDFDESKAVPFVHNSENIFRLNIEMALVYEISRNIIIKSSETR
jgi:hypothetical protein